MSRLESAITALLARWQRDHVKLVPPCDGATVRSAFLGSRVGADVVEVYCLTGGMAEGYMDDNHFALWPFERVRAERRSDEPLEIEFGDFLIDSQRYAFRRIDDDSSSVHIHYRDVESGIMHSSASWQTVTGFFENYASAKDVDEAFRVLHGWNEPQ